MIVKRKWNKSWLGPYRIDGFELIPESKKELRELSAAKESREDEKLAVFVGIIAEHSDFDVTDLYKLLGNSSKLRVEYRGGGHSYNHNSIGDIVISFDHPIWKKISKHENGEYSVGCGVSIRELEKVLLDDHRRLINRGNFDQQSFIGAALQGTHGFGPSASIIECVTAQTWIKGCCVRMRIRTAPLTSYRCVLSVKKLDEMNVAEQKPRRAYAVMPYSRTKKQRSFTVLSAEYTEMDTCTCDNLHLQCGACFVEQHHRDHAEIENKPIPLRIRIFWRIDRFTPIRRLMQWAISKLPSISRTVFTDDHDVDSIYDPMPGFAGRDTWDFKLWALRPAYTCQNLSIFVKPEHTEAFLEAIVEEADKIRKGMLRSFIAVRELVSISYYSGAGNEFSRVNAFDMYVTKTDKMVLLLNKLETKLMERTEFRPIAHAGKSHGGANVEQYMKNGTRY